MKIILGDICYPKSDALVIPANAMGSMTRGRPARIIKDGLGGISKEAKEVTSKQKIEVGDVEIPEYLRLHKLNKENNVSSLGKKND